MSYNSKSAAVEKRKLRVQKLSIPFQLTANGTPASVILRNDEPSVMFLKSEGVDQITAALDSGETLTFSASPNDVNGILNILVRPGETVEKVISCRMVSLSTGVAQPLYRGDADGLSSSKASIGLILDSSVNHATTDVDAVIEVEYIIQE